MDLGGGVFKEFTSALNCNKPKPELQERKDCMQLQVLGGLGVWWVVAVICCHMLSLATEVT